MNQRLDDFLDLSVALTGFGRLQLQGTGVAAEYLATLDAIVPSGIVARLLETFRGLAGADAIGARILDDAVLGPVARNVIVLWYSGTWTPLPEEWWRPQPRPPGDVGHVVSPAAYLAGLQWTAIAAHPAGGLPPGFGSWAALPLGVQA